MYRVLVIEDKPGEADRLRQMISEYGEDRDLEFQVVWARTAVELPEERRAFDLIFMDIGLPGINGMEAAEMLRTFDSETPLIFVTDLAQYAVKGYQVDALDFIIKPVQYYDFALRMDRAMRFVKRNDRGRLSIMTREGIRIFSLSDLVYVDVLDHNLNYHLAGGETLSLRGSLSKVGGELLSQDFVRISVSCLVNMAHIQSVQRDAVRVSNGDVLYFSRPKRKAALTRITDYLGGSF